MGDARPTFLEDLLSDLSARIRACSLPYQAIAELGCLVESFFQATNTVLALQLDRGRVDFPALRTSLSARGVDWEFQHCQVFDRARDWRNLVDHPNPSRDSVTSRMVDALSAEVEVSARALYAAALRAAPQHQRRFQDMLLRIDGPRRLARTLEEALEGTGNFDEIDSCLRQTAQLYLSSDPNLPNALGSKGESLRRWVLRRLSLRAAGHGMSPFHVIARQVHTRLGTPANAHVDCWLALHRAQDQGGLAQTASDIPVVRVWLEADVDQPGAFRLRNPQVFHPRLPSECGLNDDVPVPRVEDLFRVLIPTVIEPLRRLGPDAREFVLLLQVENARACERFWACLDSSRLPLGLRFLSVATVPAREGHERQRLEGQVERPRHGITRSLHVRTRVLDPVDLQLLWVERPFQALFAAEEAAQLEHAAAIVDAFARFSLAVLCHDPGHDIDAFLDELFEQQEARDLRDVFRRISTLRHNRKQPRALTVLWDDPAYDALLAVSTERA